VQKVIELERQNQQLENNCHQLQESLSQVQADYNRVRQENGDIKEKKLMLLEQGKREYNRLLEGKIDLDYEMITMRGQSMAQYD
jgi:septal ring factor EnvC (AmiA/AmiB activator)